MVMWRRRDLPDGLCVARLESGDGVHRAEGWEIGREERRPWAVRFRLSVDSDWATRTFEAEVLREDGAASVRLEAGAPGRWTVDGMRREELDGCLDVDISATPLTNTLSIRRLGLTPGQSEDIDVVWILIPELELVRAQQRYTRLDDDPEGYERWEYRSLPDGMAHLLTVDEEGLVLDYEHFAVRVSA
jgi:hypothetical protein